MKRFAVLMFGVFSYATFLAVFLYAIGFVGNFAVPTTLDGAAKLPWLPALAINLLLVTLFGLQHSVMARPGFKRWWTRFVPVAIERSTYVLCTNIVLAVLFWQWQPIGVVIWDVPAAWARAVLYGVYAGGWLTVLVTTFLINHFDLFGLRQVWLYFRGRPYTPLGFATPGPYKLVRHPMYIGWMTVFWAAPTMTIAHLAFAAGLTAHILIAIYFEERDLVAHLGPDYAAYRRRVPMLIPRLLSPREVRSTAPVVADAAAPRRDPDSTVALQNPLA